MKADRRVSRWSQAQGVELASDQVAMECPVAVVFNGISYAVMMLTPDSLEEFAYGFALSEGLVERLGQIYGVEVNTWTIEMGTAYELDIEISSECAQKLGENRRAMAGRTGCGLCGIESLDKAIRPVKRVTPGVRLAAENIDQAVRQLEQHQPLQSATGGAHAAAWCAASGEILKVYEDVGRHNAMDKLLGYISCQKLDPTNGFVLISSRGSYEIIQKAAALGVSNLVTVSAPTALACELAAQAGIYLVGFARPGRQVIYNEPKLES